METYILAMTHSCKRIIPLIYMVDNCVHLVVLPMKDATVNVSMHKYITGELVLLDIFPPEFTPSIKHYLKKLFFYVRIISKKGINLVKVDTLQQLGDLIMKGFPNPTFEYPPKYDEKCQVFA